MNCKNPYCPLDYDPKLKVCQECRHKPDETPMDLPPGFEDVFKGFK